MKNAREMIQAKREKVNQRLDTLEEIASTLPSSLFEYKFSLGTSYEYLGFTLPYDLRVLRQARKQLGNDWKQRQVWGDNETYLAFAYINPLFKNVEVQLSMRTSQIGSTCGRIQIGQETKPVYKIVCSE